MSDALPVLIRGIAPGEEAAVSALVDTVFRQDVAPVYAPDGVAEFLRYATEAGLRDRRARCHVILVAAQGDSLVGMLEMRMYAHISLLFVDRARQRQGIGRALVEKALELCQAQSSPAAEITVNSSPNAVNAYRRFGFRETGELQVRNGIGFVPMSLSLSRANSA